MFYCENLSIFAKFTRCIMREIGSLTRSKRQSNLEKSDSNSELFLSFIFVFEIVNLERVSLNELKERRNCNGCFIRQRI